MRTPHRQQLQLDCQPISSLKLNSKCRDRIVPILRALQHIYQQPKLRERVLALIAIDVLGDANPNRGREGMTLWQILVLASVRLGCNFTYDQLQDLAENHQSLMCLMQVRGWQEEVFTWKRIRDNICCVRPETIEKINHLIVAEGHGLEPSAAEAVRGDAFVAETNIHYPTESSLILDGLEKLLKLAPELSSFIGFAGWRQHQSLWKKAKQAARQIGRLKKGPNFQARLKTGYQKLFHIADLVLSRTQAMLDDAMENLAVYQNPSLRVLLEELAYWHSATEHVRGTAHRRVVEGERVPNSQKLFSLHEPDTELIKRGKARQPVEFGHSVLVIEDAWGFICHYKVVPLFKEEREILIPEMKTLQERLGGKIRRASFDRGFHSAQNQTDLAEIIDHPCLPKTGVKQAANQDAEASVQFRQARQNHPGIESAIGALQSGNGLAKCRDHSSIGYARYIGLGVLGRNLLMLGKLILSREDPDCLASATLRGTQAA